jgi:hypothetical protein
MSIQILTHDVVAALAAGKGLILGDGFGMFIDFSIIYVYKVNSQKVGGLSFMTFSLYSRLRGNTGLLPPLIEKLLYKNGVL